MRRMVLAAVTVFGFAVPASIAVVAMAPAAQAASSGSCAKVKGSVTSNTLQFSKCSPVPKADKHTFKTLSSSGIVSLATGGNLTWSGTATVTFGPPTLVTPPTNPCKTSGKLAQDTVEEAVGTVTAGDGVVSHTGDSYSIEICISTKNTKIYFAPGTNLSL